MTKTSEILRFNFVFEEGSSVIQLAAEKNSGKLVARCNGFFGLEDTVPDFKWDYTMDEGDWDKLMMIFEDSKVDKWSPAYVDESVEDGTVWSLEIHTLGRHTLSEGYARFPPNFEDFKQDIFGFLRMKRRQVKPTLMDFRYIAVAEQDGLITPIIFADKMEKTFTFFNLFDDIEHDGTYFLKEGDWNKIVDAVRKHKVFGYFEGLPPAPASDSKTQFSVSIGCKGGVITQRFRGDRPAWWDAFARDIFETVKSFYNDGRKSADGNINRN